MRLTLRTLLALRDGVLDRRDAADLEQRLRQSTTAQAIEKRIAAVVSDRRISSLSVDERGFALDANDVARFLDDTLPADRVPEFERKCLENNALLAEAAACHEVLTRALQDAVPISLSLRSRIYSLDARNVGGRQSAANDDGTVPATVVADSSPANMAIKRSDGSHPEVDGPHVAAADRSAAPGTPPREDGHNSGSRATLSRTGRDIGGAGLELNDTLGQQVPEYLKLEQRHRFANLAKGFGLLALLGLTSALAIGPWHRVAELLRPQITSPSVANRRSIPSVDSIPSTRENQPAQTKASDAPSNAKAETLASDQATANEAATADGDAVTSDAVSAPDAPSDANGKMDPKQVRDPREAPPAAMRAQWRSTSTNPGLGVVWSESANDEGGVEASRRWQPHALGRDSALAKSRAWLLMPGSRNEFQWSDGQRWSIAGDAMLTWSDPADPARPIGVIARNMMLLPGPSQRFEFATPSGIARVVCDAAGPSVIGLETVDHRMRIDPSQVPMTIVATWQTNIVAVQGSCSVFLEWVPNTQQSALNPSEASAPTAVTLRESEYVAIDPRGLLGPQFTDTPWPRSLPSDEDWNALAALKAIAPDSEKEWNQRLLDAASSSQGEVAALAIRARIQMGQYDRLFGPDGIFQHPELQPHWSRIIDQIARSLANPQHHELFLKSLREQTSERFSQILRLLSWPTADELAAGGDKFLVDALSDSRIDVRALAILRLRSIVGDDLGYDAAVPSAESIQRWKNALNQDKIRLAPFSSGSSPDLP